MMMMSAIPPQTTLPNPNGPYQTSSNLLFMHPKPHNPTPTLCRASSSSSTPLRYVNSSTYTHAHGESSSNDNNFGKINESDDGRAGENQEEEDMVASASAVAAIIRKVSTSPVEFVQRIEKAGSKNRGGGDGGGGGLVLPSVDFRRLCLEQLDLFRRIVHPEALLSVYVRPAGSYVMDQLELRRIALYPVVNVADIVILEGNFSIPAGLRAAEAALSSRAAEFFPELRSVVFPMVKHPFVVGFLVAEFPHMIWGGEASPSPGESCFLPNITDSKLMEVHTYKDNSTEIFNFTTDQRLNAENISRSLAMAHVMDQKAILLQQSSWQNNVRMSGLVEQIRGSLSSIRTLSKMLSIHMRRSEISFDIVEDILMQGDHMRNILQQLQDAVYLTKANIIHNNGGKLKKVHETTRGHPNSINEMLESYDAFSLNPTPKDSEVPMPPLALAPLKPKAVRRPCNVSDVLTDLIGAVEPLARKQQRFLKVSELSRPLQVAVEEPALRQALSNLIEGALLRTQVGGTVEIVSTGAPAGGALIIIDDDGPDMHYMTQMHSLTPFGTDLFSEDKVEDNMTWNFIAGLTVAREILESYGSVVRVISPRISDVGIGAGGTRIEMWLPYTSPGTDEFNQV